jgi:hypothetical protein
VVGQINRAYVGLLLFSVCGLAGCGNTTAGPSESTSSPEPRAAAPSPEVYREVRPADGIKFYSKTHMEMYRGGALHEEQFQLFLIGDDGKDIPVDLASTTVDEGRVETKEFGILKIDVPRVRLLNYARYNHPATRQNTNNATIRQAPRGPRGPTHIKQVGGPRLYS